MSIYEDHIPTDIELDRQADELDKVKVRCKCGHRVIIPHWVDKQLCHWCHNYVYKDKSLEFKERLKEAKRRIE